MYSERVNDPRILAAVKKNRRATGVFGMILVPLPLAGFVIYSLVTGEMELKEALTIGGIVSGVFLVFALISAAVRRAKKPYEATVIDKKERRVLYHGNDSSRDNNTTVTEYTTVVRTTKGKKKKIVEREGSQVWAYGYLQIGDRFRFHPQFDFPYELYDKSKAPYIVCVGCATRNPVEGDVCSRCGIPLLK
jgi:ribosomal protein L40E